MKCPKSWSSCALSSGGHELEWGKEDSFERQRPQEKKRNGHPVCLYGLQNGKSLTTQLKALETLWTCHIFL